MENRKVILLLAFILFLNLFLFHFVGNTAFVLFAIASYKFIFFTFVSSFDFKKFITYFIPLALLSLILLFRANGFVILITVLSVLTYLTACVYLFSRQIPFFNSWLEVIFTPLRLFVSYITAIPMAFGLIKTASKSPSFGKSNMWVIMKGIILSLPILIILISLLASADPIYGKFINNLFNIKIDWATQTIQRIIFSAVIFFFLLPLLHFPRAKDSSLEISLPKPVSFVSEMSVVLFLVATTILSFLIVQFPYIFASVPKETSLIQFGVKTYSEYVRRGFFELMLAAFFIYAVVISGLFILRNSISSQSKKLLTFLQLFVLGELLVFILSLFRRIWLYQSFHGWSLVRIYGGIFLIGLTGFTITLILRHIIVRRWVFKETIFTFSVLLFLGFFNTESFISTTNNPPTVNNHIDYVYLSRLSPDGYLGWKKAYDYAYGVLITRKLLEKPLINKDERREIVYAARIIYELSNNYNHLIYHFGTKNEIKEYLTTLINIIEQGNATDQEREFELERVFEIRAKLKENHSAIGVGTNVFSLIPQGAFPKYATYKGWMIFDIYPDGYSNRKYPDSFDRFFMLNSPSIQAYKLLKDKIGLKDLLTLQKMYQTLAVKIARQPDNERGFDIDISFSSPFVD